MIELLAASLVTAAAVASTAAPTVRSFEDAEASRAGVSAQILAAPKDTSPAEFAAQLAEREGPRTGALPSGGTDGPIPTAGLTVFTRDNRTVMLLFRANEAQRGEGLVCRLEDRGLEEIGPAHRRAYNWCFEQLGSSATAARRPVIPALPKR